MLLKVYRSSKKSPAFHIRAESLLEHDTEAAIKLLENPTYCRLLALREHIARLVVHCPRQKLNSVAWAWDLNEVINEMRMTL